MLIFFILRGILIVNTPGVVHVPRITLQQNEMPNEDHYQFRDDQKIECKLYHFSLGEIR